MRRLNYFILVFVLSVMGYFLVIMPKGTEDTSVVEVVRVNQAQADASIRSNPNLEEKGSRSLEISLEGELEGKYKEFQGLLQQQQWMLALDVYQAYYDAFMQLDSINALNHPLKAQLVKTMLFLSASDEQKELDSLINYTLLLYKQDADFIQIKMNVFIKRAELSKALDLYFTNVNQFKNQSDNQFFIDQFDKWLGSQFNVWFLNQSYQSIEFIWLKLVRFDPTRVLWQIQLTKSLIGQEKYKEALAVIKPFQFDWDHQNEIEELIQNINNNYEHKNIDLVKIGNHYQVKGQFSDNKIYPDQVTLNLLIDTGASFTVIDQQVFEGLFANLSVEYVKTVNTNTANGRVEAKMYEVAVFSIGEYTVKDFNILVIDFLQEGSSNQGLLGMNFLQNFKFNIDQVNSVLYLSR